MILNAKNTSIRFNNNKRYIVLLCSIIFIGCCLFLSHTFVPNSYFTNIIQTQVKTIDNKECNIELRSSVFSYGIRCFTTCKNLTQYTSVDLISSLNNCVLIKDGVNNFSGYIYPHQI